MKIDFNNIIVKTIEGNETKVEIAQDLAAVLYKSSVMLEGLDISRQLYHEGEIEVTVELAGIIKDIVKANFFAVVQEALNPILDSIVDGEAKVDTVEEDVPMEYTPTETCINEDYNYNGQVE